MRNAVDGSIKIPNYNLVGKDIDYNIRITEGNKIANLLKIPDDADNIMMEQSLERLRYMYTGYSKIINHLTDNGGWGAKNKNLENAINKYLALRQYTFLSMDIAIEKQQERARAA